MSFLRSENVRWFEKLDVLLSCASLFLPAIYLFFLIVFCLMMPYYFGQAKALHLSLFGSQFTIGNAYILKDAFNSIWTLDFYIVTLIMIFAPVLGCFNLFSTEFVKVIRLLILSAVPYLSMMLVCIFSIVSYAITGKAAFLVTGNKSAEPSFISSSEKKAGLKKSIYSLNYQSPLVRFLELILGVFFTLLCLKTLNLSLLAFSFSLMLGFFLYSFGWDNKFLRPLLFVPFFVIMVSMGFMGVHIMGMQGIFNVFFLMHF